MYFFTNFYNSKPFIDGNKIENRYTGLFPDLLSLIVGTVCTGCKSRSRPPFIYFNRSMEGRDPMKDDLKGAIANIDETVHFTFPIFGQLFIHTFSGFPFIGIIQSQGIAMIVYQPKVVSVGFAKIFAAVWNGRSVIAISILLMMLVGWLLWFGVSIIFISFPYWYCHKRRFLGTLSSPETCLWRGPTPKRI